MAATLLASLLLMGGSTIPPGEQGAQVRSFTRPIEFDFLSWTLDALAVKGKQLAVGASAYLEPQRGGEIVLDFLDLERQIRETENQLQTIYGDPGVQDPAAAAAALQDELDTLNERRERLGPLAEAIIQDQLEAVLEELDFTVGGQPLPPVLYHTTPPPNALIVSPRAVIQQDQNISIDPGMTAIEQEALENQVDRALDVSSLVVDIGGVGLYPTMVMRTSSINWLTEVVAHEWTHNFLTLRPLGISVFSSQELLTMNETTASIAGKEIGRALVARFYPAYLPPPPAPAPEQPEEDSPVAPPEPPAFDIRAEMHETRLTADALLAEGRIEEAEAYMEKRRQFLWDHGYQLRKLNQAYFAFYGSYADQPGGPAGDDPVGEAVRMLRSQSDSLADFVRRIAWVTSFDALQALVEET